MTSNASRLEVEARLREYYQSSTRYRDDLATHDERFLAPFVMLVERYVEKGSSVLDLGCGTGLSTHLLNQNGYQTTGVDLSPLFLQVEKANHPNTDLLAGNALQAPFPSGAFDAVVAFEFIEHVPDIPALLDEAKRLLRPGGFLVLHSPNLFSPYLPAFDLMRMAMGRAGRPVWAETPSQAWRWLLTNLGHSMKRWLVPRPLFEYRDPDLSENRIGGDADSVFFANPMDIARYLQKHGFIIDQRAHAMSLKNKFVAALTPNFAPYMGLVAHKRRRS